MWEASSRVHVCLPATLAQLLEQAVHLGWDMPCVAHVEVEAGAHQRAQPAARLVVLQAGRQAGERGGGAGEGEHEWQQTCLACTPRKNALQQALK